MYPGPGVLRGRVVPLIAGGALPLAFAPFALYWIAPPALAFLFWSWRTSPREAAWRGFLFGAAAFAAGTWWLYVSVRLVGGTPLPVALLLLGGLVALMAAWIALCGWIVARLCGDGSAWRAAWVAAGSWVLVEWLRGWAFTGFPWLSIGYGQIDGPLAAWAPLGGVYGVSFVAALGAGALVALGVGNNRVRALAVMLLVAIGAGTALAAGRSWTTPAGPPLDVGLVQGSIPQLLKWQPGERRATMDLYRSMTEPLTGLDLVVWPEAAVPAPDSLVRDYLEELAGLATARGMQLFVGILTHDEERDEYRNSLLAIGATAGVYHKRHLVPFGEFFPVPGVIRSWMRMMNLPYSDLERGEAVQPLLRVQDVPLAPTICYEDAYGAEQRAFLPEARVLVNVSNDAWFGDTIAPHQHLQIARMRALETGRYLLRSTNTGITAIIDERGRVTSDLPQFERAVLTGTAQPHTGSTPWVRTGNGPVLVLCLLAIAGAMSAAALSRRRA